MRLRTLAKQAHEMARSKGFWDGEAADVCKKLLLIHSEVSEAAEEVRKDSPLFYAGSAIVGIDEGNGVVTVGLKPEGVGTELADVLIRTLDLMHGLGVDVEKTVHEKMKFNSIRGPRHGKKF